MAEAVESEPAGLDTLIDLGNLGRDFHAQVGHGSQRAAARIERGRRGIQGIGLLRAFDDLNLTGHGIELGNARRVDEGTCL